MESRVELRHPTTGDVWMCPAAAVDGWLAKGWKKQATPADTTTTRKDK